MGNKKRLNPIIYLNKDSYVAEPLSIIAENGLKLNELKDENVKKLVEIF